MSVEAFTWALSVPIGGNAKVILLGLANHAHPDGSHAYPAVDTLAAYAHCDRRSVQRNLRKLEEDGWISKNGVGGGGTLSYQLAMGGGETPPATLVSRGGDAGVAGGATLAPPEPSVEPSGTGDSPRETTRDLIPDDFPDALRPHARIVLPLLQQVAVQHGAREVRALALARVMMGRPRKPFVKSAHDFAAWAVDPGRSLRDVVASYRTWLDREHDLQGFERITPRPSASSVVDDRSRYDREG